MAGERYERARFAAWLAARWRALHGGRAEPGRKSGPADEARRRDAGAGRGTRGGTTERAGRAGPSEQQPLPPTIAEKEVSAQEMGLPRGFDQAICPRSRKGGFTPPVVPPAQLWVRLCRQLCRQLWVQPSSRAPPAGLPRPHGPPKPSNWRRKSASCRRWRCSAASCRASSENGRYGTPPLRGPGAGARPVRGLRPPTGRAGRCRSRTVARRPASGVVPFARGRGKFVGLRLFVGEDDALDLRPAAGAGNLLIVSEWVELRVLHLSILVGRVSRMRDDLVPSDLWERVAPLLPPAPERRRRHPGRLRVPDRTALAGILYVLRTGVAWRDVPAETVGCSGITAWRRLRDWTEAGVWPRLHAALLAELRRADLLDLDDCAVDGSHVRAVKGGITSARRPSTALVPVPSTT